MYAYMYVCMHVCKRKTTRASDTKRGRHTGYGSCLACSDPEINRSKVKVTWLSNAGVGMYVDMTV